MKNISENVVEIGLTASLMVLSFLFINIATVSAQTPTPTSTPSLEETMEFIKNKLPTRLSWTDSDGDQNEQTLQFNYRIENYDVKMTLETLRIQERSNDSGFIARNKYEFNLEDLEDVGFYETTPKVSLFTLYADDKIKDSHELLSIRRNISLHRNKIPDLDIVEQSSAAEFYSGDKETADRVVKAFKHAIKLAKEMDKKEPF